MLQRESPVAPNSPATERDVWLTIPNALTVLRLISVAPFAWLAMRGSDRAALILFVVAGLTDTLDGTIARHWHQKSRIGRLLDPLVDKLFTGAAYVVLSAFRGGLSSIPVWVMVAVILRDILILCGSLVVYKGSRNSDFQPSIYGKLNTFLEIGIVVLFLSQSDFPLFGAHFAVGVCRALNLASSICRRLSSGGASHDAGNPRSSRKIVIFAQCTRILKLPWGIL